MSAAQQWVATDFGDLDVFRFREIDVPAPGPGEVTIAVRAAGMNPADFKHVRAGSAHDRSSLPIPIGYEVAGVLEAVGPDTEIASGGGQPGDEVLAFRISGGYATRLNVAAKDVFAKPPTLDDPQAANLLLAGATAAETLQVTDVTQGDTIVVHGASGAVGVSVLQQAARLGATVVGTASPGSFDTVRRFGGTPVAYGAGLESRLRELAPAGYVATIDTVGTDEAVDVSLALVADRSRIVTIAAFARAKTDGILAIGGAMPVSAAYRDSVRPRLIELAGAGDLVVPMARTFPLSQAVEALTVLRDAHPGGKLALIPD